MNTVIYQMQRVLIVVAMSAMVGYGEEPNSEDGNPSPKIEKTLVAHPGETLQVNSKICFSDNRFPSGKPSQRGSNPQGP